uniref:Uncharacterized protein n=1 Tax=Anopheles albimanus TaxID=7167 RepID=A0A182FZ30_ANOAL
MLKSELLLLLLLLLLADAGRGATSFVLVSVAGARRRDHIAVTVAFASTSAAEIQANRLIELSHPIRQSGCGSQSRFRIRTALGKWNGHKLTAEASTAEGARQNQSVSPNHHQPHRDNRQRRAVDVLRHHDAHNHTARPKTTRSWPRPRPAVRSCRARCCCGAAFVSQLHLRARDRTDQSSVKRQ